MDMQASAWRRAALISALTWPLADVARAFGFGTAGSGRIVHLSLRAGGSGVIRLPDLTAETVEVQLSGSANISLAGQANELALNLGGSALLDAAGLQVRRARAEMGGSSHARVSASESLGGAIGGSSQLRYRGEARVNVARGGSGRLEPL